MKPHILIFSTAYLPLVGGAEMAVKAITERAANFEFDLITARLNRKLPAAEKIGNVMVYRIGIGWPFFDKILLTFFGRWRAAKLHARRPYNGVWAIMASYGGYAAAGFSKSAGVPLMLTLQEGDPLEYIENRARRFRKYFVGIFSQAKILQAISFFLLEWGRRMGFSGDYAVVVPNGVDIADFTKHFSAAEIAARRSRFGFPPEAKICATVSRLVQKNGVDTVIDALSYLPPDICLVVCGVGKLEKKLRTLAAAKKLEDRVLFLGGVSHQKLPLILKAADLFVRASRSEGLGNAFLEAMASRVTTIGTTVGGIPDFIKDGETGFLCEPNNPTHLAKTIERALKLDARARHAMHERALNTVKRQYNWDIIAEEMKTLFTRLCNSAKTEKSAL